MPIQSNTALAAAVTFSLALGTPLLASQLSGTALAQTGGGGAGASGGATGGTNSGVPGGGTGGAIDRSGSTDQRGGSTDRGGVSDPMRRSGPASGATGTDTMRSGSMDRGGATGSSMSGSSGTDATRGGMRDRGATGSDAGLVGNEKLSAALGALDGDSATTRRRGGTARNARLVQIEEYETAMRNAHALTDPAARNSAISEARARLTGASGQPVPSDAFTRVDSVLGLPPAPMTR